MDRKQFLQIGGLASITTMVPGMMAACSSKSTGNDLFFDISLAEWSLHRTLFDGKMKHLEFPEAAKNKFGIHAVEYVNQFFKDKAKDKDYLDEMNSRCEDLGVTQVLIMIDGEGPLAALDDKKRSSAVEKHYKWVEAAQYLDCHSIRVNLRGDGQPEEKKKAAVDGLSQLATFAQDYDIGVVVENHGGLSSNGQWLSSVIEKVNMENCGTLPDFGNFCLEYGADGCTEDYDPYKGVKEMMTYAKGVSAKSYEFDKKGHETTIDFSRMLKIVKEAGYTGHIGIEYEGDGLSEAEGIRATKELLTEAGKELST